MLSATGTVEQWAKYYPYGSMRAGSTMNSTITDKHFTGQQEEGTAFGLYDYGARFYSTVLGRFTSADPVAFKLGNPQTIDRYAYAIDNPLRYTDPTGLEAEWTTIDNALQGLHRLADALNQRRFMAWGGAIREAGVPENRVGDIMRLIQQAYEADPSQDIYVVHCSAGYAANQPVIEELPEGEWPADTEIEYADQIDIQTGTENEISGTIDISAVVAIPRPGLPGLSFGTITVLCDDTQHPERAALLTLKLKSGNGTSIDAEHLPASGQTWALSGESQYTFIYPAGLGRPSNLVVNISEIQEWTYSPKKDQWTLVEWNHPAYSPATLVPVQ